MPVAPGIGLPVPGLATCVFHQVSRVLTTVFGFAFVDSILNLREHESDHARLPVPLRCLTRPCHVNLFAADVPPVLRSTRAGGRRLLLDFGWKFHLGNEWGFAQNLAKAGTGSGPASMSFSDASWRTVNLPHDWAVELPFDSTADGSHGFKPVGPGFPQTASPGIAARLTCRKPTPASASG